MTILVFGKSGQVARALGAHDGVTCLSREDADLGDPDSCAKVIRDAAPEAVINAAAYTAVDQAETDTELAWLINAAAPGAMAMTCAAMRIPFVTISTDYVFDGSGKKPWPTDAETDPLGVYGESKRKGEELVQAMGGAYAILRTSWVFAPGGKNFVHTMLRLGAERDSLNIVADQIGGPTPAQAIADACLTMARTLMEAPDKSGIYHLSGAPNVSWADFAREIFRQADLSVDVSDIATKDYPTPAQRPLNSRLNCDSLQAQFGVAQPDWRDYLPAVIAAQAQDKS